MMRRRMFPFTKTLSAALLLLTISACTVFAEPDPSLPTATPPLPTIAIPDASAQPTQAIPTAPAAQAPTAAPTAAPIGGQENLTAADFSDRLITALESKDFAALQSLMGSRFALAFWRSEGSELAPDAAVAMLQQGVLASGAAPAVVTGVDPVSLLEGADPLAFFPPDAVDTLVFERVGQDGQSQALVIIGQDPASGRFYWKGMLVAMGGFVPTPSAVDLNTFSERLADAVQTRNFDAMRALMPERFSISIFNASLTEVTSADALDQMRAGIFANGSQPTFAWNSDVPALLGGADPLALWGPVAEVVRAVHVTGLGSTAAEEAVIVIGRNALGEFYWHGVLLPPSNGRFASAAGPVGDALPTNVKFIQALDALHVRSGPGLNYASEGRLREGELAQVTGKSPDDGWWQILCVQDASGRCWVSADPTLSSPQMN